MTNTASNDPTRPIQTPVLVPDSSACEDPGVLLGGTKTGIELVVVRLSLLLPFGVVEGVAEVMAVVVGDKLLVVVTGVDGCSSSGLFGLRLL